MKLGKKLQQDDDRLLLRASAKRLFETLMEETSDRIYIKDTKSRFISVSRMLAKIHGLEDRHALEGKTDFDLFTSEHAQQAFDDEQEILRTGVPIINKVEKETFPDGRVGWASTTKSPVHLHSGKIIGIIGISRDITSEKIAQEQVAESERKLREQNETMKSDYESARRVQEVMIPGRVPRVAGIRTNYVWKPMSAVGGDIINFPRNPEKRLLFFLGDVCGHGITAAFYTVLLKYLTDHYAETYRDNPHDFLQRINSEIIGRFQGGFVTGLCGHWEGTETGATLHLSHAGHRQVVVYRKLSGKTELIELKPGSVLGLPGLENSPTEKIELLPGDRFYAFTDGMVESADKTGEEYGMDRLMKEFRKHATLPLKESLESSYQALCDFSPDKQQQDDVTLIGFEVT